MEKVMTKCNICGELVYPTIKNTQLRTGATLCDSCLVQQNRCINCGKPKDKDEYHYVPASFGESSFWLCDFLK